MVLHTNEIKNNFQICQKHDNSKRGRVRLSRRNSSLVAFFSREILLLARMHHLCQLCKTLPINPRRSALGAVT